MKEIKKRNAVMAALVSFFVVAFVACAFVSCGMQNGNIAINLPPIESRARAIAPERIEDLKGSTKSYHVAVEANGHLEEKRGGTGSYMFSVPVGAVATITLECLNGDGEVIVRAVKTIKVYAGVNNVDIKLSQDGEEIVPSVTYNVTFAEGAQTATSGSMPQPTQSYIGGIIDLSTKPTATGYDFKGWKVTKTGEQSVIDTLDENANQYTMPGEYAITLTAQWQIKSYTVTYSWGNSVTGVTGDLPTQSNVEHGSTFEVQIPASVTYAGYNFLGWDTEQNKTSDPTYFNGANLTVTVTDNITLYAVWEAIPYRELSEAVVGDVICANGKVLSASDITAELQSQTIAVVYKVDTSEKKVWGVGKVLSASSMAWADSNAQGYNQKITDLQEENSYTDGSTGVAILRTTVTDADDANLATNYSAWDYACNYGTNQNLSSFQTGWYLPSKQELTEVYDNKATIETALAQTGVSKTSFGTDYYWSSTQYASDRTVAWYLWFKGGEWNAATTKSNTTAIYVCAVRQFTW